MPKLLLTDPTTGQQHKGTLPASWRQVPLSAFLKFHELHEGHRSELVFLHSVIALTGLPAHLFEEDVSLARTLAEQMPFFSDGLPEDEPVPVFTHKGRRYEHVGDFGKLAAGQFEALLSFLDAATPKPVFAAPDLLAVLYREQGTEQDPASVSAATKAFHSLPMSVAWPAVAAFLTAWAQSAWRIQAYSAAKLQVETALRTVEQTLTQATVGASPGRSSRILGWLGKRYVRSVRGQLKSC